MLNLPRELQKSRQEMLKQLEETSLYVEHNGQVPITCDECIHVLKCKSAYNLHGLGEPYNVDGDCLGLK